MGRLRSADRDLPRSDGGLAPVGVESRFWSVMVYDNQTRSMIQTDQAKPDIGSQSGTVETNSDGSIDVYFGPMAPDGKTNNWLQIVPGKGYFAILRLYSPEAPVLRQVLAAQRDRADLIDMPRAAEHVQPSLPGSRTRRS